jgi:DNA-directed RNA polymerase sigma subunit (sigma70/sigma32)
LDVADEGGTSLEEVGELLGLTRERIQQLEFVALRKTKKHLLLIGVTLEDFARDPSKVQER